MVHSAVHANQCDYGAPWLQAQEDKLVLILIRKKVANNKKAKQRRKQ